MQVNLIKAQVMARAHRTHCTLPLWLHAHPDPEMHGRRIGATTTKQRRQIKGNRGKEGVCVWVCPCLPAHADRCRLIYLMNEWGCIGSARHGACMSIAAGFIVTATTTTSRRSGRVGFTTSRTYATRARTSLPSYSASLSLGLDTENIETENNNPTKYNEQLPCVTTNLGFVE